MLEIINARDADVIDSLIIEALVNTTSTKQADAIIKYYDSNFVQKYFGNIKNMSIINHIVNNYKIESPSALLKKIARHRDATTKAAVAVISKVLEFGGDCNDFTPKQMRKLRERGLVYITHS
jgi:hypothetical protein